MRLVPSKLILTMVAFIDRCFHLPQECSGNQDINRGTLIYKSFSWVVFWLYIHYDIVR